jgi:glycoprotein endo-alpha-1,2-mannosidase
MTDAPFSSSGRGEMISRSDLPRPLRALRLITVVIALSAAPAAAQAASNVSIFYYPWYGTPALDGGWSHWVAPETATLDIASSYFPARGLYSSSDRRVVTAQMREIASAGVGEVISSWWGWGSPEDLRLPLVVSAAHAARLSVAIHLEPYPGRTIETVEADIDHLHQLGISRFFVYRPFDIDKQDWAQLRERVQGVQLFAQTPLAGRAADAGFDGVYTYDVLVWGGDSFSRLCKQAHRAGLSCLPSVGPGYDAFRATGDLRVKTRRDGATYDRMWKGAIEARADGVTITSYNEWHEGTQIEQARGRTAGSAAAASFETYDGAYGLRGRPAERAYLDRTALWSAAFARSRIHRSRVLS